MKKRFWFDTEFLEKGRELWLISIGIVCEDGREYYAISTDYSYEDCHVWTRSNVIPKLRITRLNLKAESEIAKEIAEFTKDFEPEFWGYGIAYDQVVLMQLMKRFNTIPSNWGYFVNDLAQFLLISDAIKLPDTNPCIHNALCDARWAKEVWEMFTKMEKRKSV